MLFRRRGWLRKEYNERLLNQLNLMKSEWNREKNMVEKSFDPSDDIICQSKITEAKYFFLFKEAKMRNITVQSKMK